MFQDEAAKLIFGIIAAVVIIGVVVFIATRSKAVGGEIADKATETITSVFDAVETDSGAGTP